LGSTPAAAVAWRAAARTVAPGSHRPSLVRRQLAAGGEAARCALKKARMRPRASWAAASL